MNCLSLRLLTPVGQAVEMSRALRTLARRARQEWGCLWSEVYTSVEDENRLFLRAEWSDPQGMAAYVRSDDFTHVLNLVEMAAVSPTLEFQVDGELRGLDYVAEIRASIESSST